MRYLFALLISSVSVLSQTVPVTISPAPPPIAYTTINHFTGSNLDYSCKANATQNPSTITVSAISNAAPASATATAHGFYFATSVTQKIVVFISGLSGNWAPLNGFKIMVPTSANAMNILNTDGTNFDSSTFGAVTGTGVFTTRAPRATDKVWSVATYVYDASGNQTLTLWPVPTSGTTLQDLRGGQTAFVSACAAPVAVE